jgi:hypothetical protein
MYVADITIRLEECIDEDCLRKLERLLRKECCIERVWLEDRRRHLLMVAFDAEAVQPSMIVRSMRDHGWHASAHGL